MSHLNILTLLLTVLIFLLTLDYLQTLSIAYSPDMFYEAWNVILPKHPQPWMVHLYFGCVFALVLVGFAALPIFWVAVLLTILTPLELVCVIHNWKIKVPLY